MVIRENINTGEIKEFKNNTWAAAEIDVNESTVRKAIRDNKLVMNKYKFYNKSERIELDAIKINKKLPKILVFDIETAPMRAYVWSRWKQNIHLAQTISEWFMLTWSAKWLYDLEVKSDKLTSAEALNEDDSRITKSLWELINEADVVITHNGDSFDIPKINTRFIINGLQPPNPFRSIDTKLIAAKQFGFSSNKLDALAGYFGFEVKLDTDFKLWDSCLRGDSVALAYMEKYNIHDTELLEEVYLKLRPWIKNHVNLSLYNDDNEMQCPHCVGINMTENGFYYTNNAKYITYRCDDCGAVIRGKKTQIDKNKQKITSIPGR